MAAEELNRRSTLAYVSDILIEIEFLRSVTAGLTFEQYLKSGEKRRAIERSLEIISEASRGIPETEKALYPEIPWRRIQDLGNVIRHAYFGLSHERLWAIVENGLDTLADVIRQIEMKYRPPSL
jgi:uncharacterized protein with HEPN domain